MKQSLDNYFKDIQQKCDQPFCMQRALLTSGQQHECCWAGKASSRNDEAPNTSHVTPDAKLPESWRQDHLQAAAFLKHVAPHVLSTPVRSKVSTPHGLTFDTDTESRDCWSFSMATPKQAAGVTEMCSSVETAVSSTSADESCSGNGLDQSRLVGEVISRRLAMRKEDDNCRTPLALVARQLFNKDRSSTPKEDNFSPPTSPDLIMSSQASPQDIIETPQDTNTTCSQDLFSDINPFQSSKVCSSTPINSTPVRVEHKEQFVGNGSSPCDITEKCCHCNTQDQPSTIPNCDPHSVNRTVVNDADSSPSCNPSSISTAKVVHNHIDHSITVDDISKSPICSPDHKQTTDNQFHDNSDLMDELFANHLTQITSAITRHEKDAVLQPTSKHDNGHGPLMGSKVIDNDSGCGLTGSDVITGDTPTHTIVTDKLHITPMRTTLHPGVHRNIRPSNTTRKSAKQFKAPRLAKQVSKDEERKSLERLAKQFPSLAPSSTPVAVPSNTIPCSSSDRVSCGFVAASGKKLTVSTSALDRAAKLVEECSNETNSIETKLTSAGGDVPGVVPDQDIAPSKETELTDSYCAENMDSIDMDQFSTFTQMPGYVTKRSAEEVSTTKGGTPIGRSTPFTPRGSPPHSEDTSPTQPHDEDSIHKMFNTQVVKQFLDFHSSDEEEDKTSDVANATDELDSHTHKKSNNFYLKSHDARAPIHKAAATRSHDVHSSTHKDSAVRVYDANSPTHRTTTPHSNGHNQMMLSGFTTAGGKSVMVSAEAVASVKKLLEDEEADMIAVKDDAVDVKDGATPAGGFPGLSTASSKKVEISSESLRAAQLLKETDNVVTKGYQTPVVKFNGFCTASGSVVKVSEESIKKAKKLLDGELDDDNTVPSIPLCNGKQSDGANTPAGGFPGLSTASGKKVEISSESLHAAQQLLREDDDNRVGVTEGCQTPVVKFNGFSTAAGSVVKVSEESMKKAKKLLDEDLTHHNDLVPSIPLCDSKQSSDAMETTPANTDKMCDKVVAKRKRNPLYTTPEAVLSDRAHPKRMRFTPLVATHTPTPSSTTSSKQPAKFTTPFKAHKMGTTPQQKTTTTTPLQPVWKRSWRKQWVPPPSSCPSNDKSGNDSGLGSSLPGGDQPSNKVLLLTERDDKQFDVTDTQMESFFAATQAPVSMEQSGRKVRPQNGTLSSMRSGTSQRISLIIMTGCVRPGKYSRQQLISLGVHPEVVDVTAANAANFQFDVHHYFSQSVLQRGTVTVGDGAVLKLKNQGDHVTREQLQRAFYKSPGVDDHMIPTGWFTNHYRWVVWKLAAIEVSFPHTFVGKSLTPHWLLLHMKYRYDREVDHAHRSCIKKILEHDDNPGRCMVLVISEVVCDVTDGSHEGDQHPTVKMSDGWYSVGVVMDTPLIHLLSTNQIRVGCKLYTCGAKLVGPSEPCPPLECPDSVMLKINANSTRRAHWNAKLGFQRRSVPFPVPMSSLFPDGGIVGCVHVTVVRTYPLQHMERTAEGTCVFRNQRKEELVAKEHEIRRQQSLEDLSIKVKEEFEKELSLNGRRQSRRRRRPMTRAQISKLTDGERIEETLNSAPDPQEFEECLSLTQRTMLESYRQGVIEAQRRELEQRMSAAVKEAEDKLPPLREVVPLLKVRLAGHPSRKCDWRSKVSSCLLTVWRPSSDVIGILREGRSLKLYNVTASHPRNYSSDHIQLASTRSTRYEQLAEVDDDVVKMIYHPRMVTPVAQLGIDITPAYGQVDIIGLVITIVSSHINTANGTEKVVDKVYLGDDNENMTVVKVWDGIQMMCSRSSLTAGQVVCFTNLSYKSWQLDDGGIPSCSTSDLSDVTTNPQHSYLRTVFQEQQQFAKNNLTTYLKMMEERIAYLQ